MSASATKEMVEAFLRQSKPKKKKKNKSVEGGVDDDDTYSSSSSANCYQVYVGVVTQETDFDWYVLNTKTGISVKEVNMSSHKLPVCFGCVSIGTKIYIIGGRYGSFEPPVSFAPTEEIQIYDTLTKTWEFGPELNVPRYSPIVIFFEDKLYVFGCFCHAENNDDDRNKDIIWPSDQPWGEYAICDPATGALNKWCSLSSPPPPEVSVQPTFCRYAIDYHQKRFIFWNLAYFYSYDVPTGVWSLISVVHDIPDNMGWSLNPNVTSRNNFVYWYYYGNLFAFDLSRITNCGPPVCYLQKHPYRPPHEFCYHDLSAPTLIAVDDDEVCLIWLAYNERMYGGKYTDRVCHWTTFQIETLHKADVEDGEAALDMQLPQLHVVPKRSESFGTGNGFCIAHCVLVSQQPNNYNVNRHDISKFYQKPDIVALMEHLSRAIYVKNYNSYVLNCIEDVNGKDVENDGLPGLPYNKSVGDFLVFLGLEKYMSKFQKEDNNLKSWKILTEEDLKALGLPMGPRKELLAAISNMGG